MIEMGVPSLSFSELSQLLVVRSLLVLVVLAAVLLVDRGLRGRLTPNARFVLFFGVLLSFVVPPLWNVVLPGSAPQVLTRVAVSSAEPMLDAVAMAVSATRLEPGEQVGVASTFGLSMVRFLTLVYAVGVCLAFVLLLCRLANARRLVRRAEPGPSPGEFWTELSGPCVVGLLRPKILVPRSFRSMSPEQMAMVLRHEREHIRRGDLWTRLVQNLIQMLFWFHPGVWWFNRRIDDLREMAVDAALLRDGSVRRRDYCELLLALASKATPRLIPPRHVGLAMAGSPRMTERLRACLHPVRSGRRMWWLVLMVSLAAFLLPGGCSSTPKTAAPAASGMSKSLTPFELGPPAALPVFEGQNDNPAKLAQNSTSQIELKTWFVELSTARLHGLGTIDETAFKRLQSLPGMDLLSAPRVITLPGMAATIEVGRELIVAPPPAEPGFVGVRVDLLPQLAAGLSPATPFEQVRQQPITLHARAMLSEPVTAEERQLKGLPPGSEAIAYRSVDKTLSLADGAFAEIGRIHKMHTIQIDDRVPLLGDIPLLGRPFRRFSVEHEARTVVVLIQSVIQPSQKSDPFEPATKDR